MVAYVGPAARIGLMVASLSIAACTHQVGVRGSGDIVSSSGERDCSMAQGQCNFMVVDAYQEQYTAVPRTGSLFSHWEGCGEQKSPVCSWDVPAETVRAYWGITIPVPMIAVFEENPLQQLIADIAFMAREDRAEDSEHRVAVRRFCGQRLSQLGFDVERQSIPELGITNVIGTLPGRSPETVLVSAHYDSIRDCRGADDNASGVAGVLETARVLAQSRHQRTLVAACWDGEEIGRLGSKTYAQAAVESRMPIEVVYVYEMIGYTDPTPFAQTTPSGFSLLYPDQYAWLRDHRYRGDFIAWVYDDDAQRFISDVTEAGEQLTLPVMELPVSNVDSPYIEDLRRSDHASFWDAGIPAVMITDTAGFRNPNYHCLGGGDDPETLDYEFAVKVVRLTTRVVREALNP